VIVPSPRIAYPPEVNLHPSLSRFILESGAPFGPALKCQAQFEESPRRTKCQLTMRRIANERDVDNPGSEKAKSEETEQDARSLPALHPKERTGSTLLSGGEGKLSSLATCDLKRKRAPKKSRPRPAFGRKNKSNTAAKPHSHHSCPPFLREGRAVLGRSGASSRNGAARTASRRSR